MNEEWKKAGQIASEARDFGEDLVKPGKTYLEVAEEIEKKIISLGGKPAFPVNISINEVAAHYIPAKDESLHFKEGDLVKLDIGAQINGYIGDTAKSIDLGNNKKLIEASEEALEKAIKIVKPGVALNEIGRVIQETIESKGFSPIRNLSGHSIEQYKQHAGISVPNFESGDKTTLKEGQVIAIEPFATDGVGLIEEGKPSGIFLLTSGKQVRDRTARDVLNYIHNNYNSLPFAERWIYKKFPEFKVKYARRILMKEEIITEYNQLIEKGKGLVSQAEHTVLVQESPTILTGKDTFK